MFSLSNPKDWDENWTTWDECILSPLPYQQFFKNKFSEINWRLLFKTYKLNYTLCILSQCTTSDQYSQLHKWLQTNLCTRTHHLRGMDNSNSNKSQVPYAFNLKGFEDSLKKYWKFLRIFPWLDTWYWSTILVLK